MQVRLQVCKNVFFAFYWLQIRAIALYFLICLVVGIHNGVVEKPRQKLDAEWIKSSPCAAHTFSLVDSQAAYTLTGKHFRHISK